MKNVAMANAADWNVQAEWKDIKNRVKFDTKMLLSAYSLQYNYDWHIWLRFKFAHFSMQWILRKLQLIVGSSQSDSKAYNTRMNQIRNGIKRILKFQMISYLNYIFGFLKMFASKNWWIETIRARFLSSTRYPIQKAQVSHGIFMRNISNTELWNIYHGFITEIVRFSHF